MSERKARITKQTTVRAVFLAIGEVASVDAFGFSVGGCNLVQLQLSLATLEKASVIYFSFDCSSIYGVHT
jgi:hypothetical protein